MIDADDVPEGWALTTLGEVTAPKVVQGEPVGKEFVYIDISGVDNELKIINNPKTLPTENAPSRARQKVQPGDVLVSMTRPNLNAVAVVAAGLKDSIASTGFHVLRPTAVLTEWLFMVVRSTAFVGAMSDLVQGALYPAVRPNDIREFQFPLPPLLEQKRIVARLEALQARSRKAREALAEVPILLEQYRQSVLAAAFRGDLSAAWRVQNPNTVPATDLLERVRTERRTQWQAKYPEKQYTEPTPVDDTDLPELPEGWAWASLDELAEVQLGQRRAPEYVDETEYPYIRSGNITWRGLDLSDVKLMGIADPEPLKLRKGDILLNEASGSPTEVGKPAIWNDEIPNCCFQATVIRLRAYSTELNPHWLYFNCLRDAVLAEYATRCPGIGILHLTAKLLRSWPVPVAPIEEQKFLVAMLPLSLAATTSGLDRQLQLQREIDNFDQSLLAQAFRGELVEQDPTDEPAAAMLARLQSRTSLPAPAVKKPLRIQDVVHDLILLLRTFNKPMERAALELGLVLMLNDDSRTAILDKTATPGRTKATGRTYLEGLDHLLGDLAQAKRWIKIATGVPQMITLTTQAPSTDQADAQARRRVQETLQVMAAVKKERLPAVVEKVCHAAYELVSSS